MVMTPQANPSLSLRANSSVAHPNAPGGVGWWIWYVPPVLAGRTYVQLAEVCRQNRISHLVVKAGDAANRWAQFGYCAPALQAEGVRVYAWTYCYGDDPAAEASVAISALEAGADGLVLDIEGECEGKHAAIEELWKRIRERYPEAWVAWAPMPVIDYHDPPLYRIACRYASAHLPQFYWSALGPQYGDLHYLFALWLGWQQVWTQEGLPVLPIMPIGQAYGEATTEEMRTFVQWCRSLELPALSWWEWNASSEEQWNTVAELARQWAGSPEPAVPRFVLGFAEVASRLGAEAVGQPTEDEHPETLTVQRTSTGVMLWRPGEPAGFYRAV